jgi:hypothetical protein
MSSEYKVRRKKADRYNKDLERIIKEKFNVLGKVLEVKLAPNELDYKNCVDMLCYIEGKTKPIYVSCRVRDKKFFFMTDRRYKHPMKYDISIRYKMNGIETELRKILDGESKANYFLYGFGDEELLNVPKYTIIKADGDFPDLLKHLIATDQYQIIPNYDNVSEGIYFNTLYFPDEFILARNFQ